MTSRKESINSYEVLSWKVNTSTVFDLQWNIVLLCTYNFNLNSQLRHWNIIICQHRSSTLNARPQIHFFEASKYLSEFFQWFVFKVLPVLSVPAWVNFFPKVRQRTDKITQDVTLFVSLAISESTWPINEWVHSLSVLNHYLTSDYLIINFNVLLSALSS